MKDTGIIKGEPTKENGLIPVELGDGTLIYAQWIPNAEPVVGQAVDIERTASGSMLATAKNFYNFNQLFQQSGLQKYAKRASWDVDFANGKIWNEPFGKPKKLSDLVFFLLKLPARLKIVYPEGRESEVDLTPFLGTFGGNTFNSYYYSSFSGNSGDWQGVLVFNISLGSQNNYTEKWGHYFIFIENDVVIKTYEDVMEVENSIDYGLNVSHESKRVVNLCSNPFEVFSTSPARGAKIFTPNEVIDVPGADNLSLGDYGNYCINHKWFNLDKTVNSYFRSVPITDTVDKSSRLNHLILKNISSTIGLYMEQEYTFDYGGGELWETSLKLVNSSGSFNVDQSPFLIGLYQEFSQNITLGVGWGGYGYSYPSGNGVSRFKTFSGYESPPSWILGEEMIVIDYNPETGTCLKYEGVITDVDTFGNRSVNVAIVTGPIVVEYDFWGLYFNKVAYSKNSESVYSALFCPISPFDYRIRPPQIGELVTYFPEIGQVPGSLSGGNSNWLSNIKMLDNGDIFRIRPFFREKKFVGEIFKLKFNEGLNMYSYVYNGAVEYLIESFIDSESYPFSVTDWQYIGATTNYE